jgi:hypothetical protein
VKAKSAPPLRAASAWAPTRPVERRVGPADLRRLAPAAVMGRHREGERPGRTPRWLVGRHDLPDPVLGGG